MTDRRAWFVAAPLLLLMSTCPAARAAAGQGVPTLSEPGVSPDGAEVAFVSSGDIWTVPAAGGEARLLIAHGAAESRPLYSPDGKRLAFVSDRSGNGDIYVLDLAGGEVTRVTYGDGRERLDAWSADGAYLYFSSNGYDVGSGANDVYRVRATGGTPMPVAHEAYANEFFAAPRPGGSAAATAVAYCAGGIADRTWWRRGRSHGDECTIDLITDDGGSAGPRVQHLTAGGARDLWPMWSPDGGSLYYVSDRAASGGGGGGGAACFNVWVKTPGGEHKPVTKFADGRVHWPTISQDGRTIVFERGNGIWRLDAKSGEASEVPIKLRGASVVSSPDHHAFGNFDELALSPDGKKVAVVTHGEVFAASAKDDGYATRVTRTSAIESHATWSRDSRKLAYVSNRDGRRRIYQYDFGTGAETRLTGGEDDTRPRYSPDNHSLAYQHDGTEIRLLDLYTGKERALVAKERFERAPFDKMASAYAISPGGDWVAYASAGPKGFENVWVVPAGGREEAPRQVTFLANAGSNALSWSPGGSFLLFGTGQRTEDYQLARVDLLPRTPRFREDQFRDLFREQRAAPRGGEDASDEADDVADDKVRTAETAPTSTTKPATTQATSAPFAAPPSFRSPIVFEDIRRRLRLLNPGFDVDYHAISPDGKVALLVGTSAGQANLYLYPLDDAGKDGAVAKQLTSTPGPKSFAQFSPDGKEVFFLEAGKVTAVSTETRVARPLAVVAEMDADFDADKLQVADQAWGYVRDHFHDPKFNGADWPAMRARYGPLVAGARTEEELRRALLLMVGELDASHVGIGSAATIKSSTGRLGLRFERAEYERDGRLRVSEVFALSPAAIAGVGVGDYILGVDGRTVGGRTNLDQLLAQKIGKRVSVRVAVTADGKGQRDVALQPVDGPTERGLGYRAWVDARRKYVDRASNGRLGYVHLPDMSEQALARLNADLDSDNQGRDGVVVDVRNNRGGFVNGFAIDIFARRNYLTMVRRGFGPVPSRVRLGQRSLGVPTVLVTNRGTYSDGEDFTEAYRALKLGKVVGEPTAGCVIFTSIVSLLDGTRMGLPHTRVLGADGRPLEGNPRAVDVPVARGPGEAYGGKDAQLDAAVQTLIEGLGKN